MAKNVSQKLIESHLFSGKMVPGQEISICIDQTLTQDATGTPVMLELEALGLERVKTDVSVQYVDHNLIQAGARLHQAGCNGCIGMGQAPASGKISLRTVPRNFRGRTGTKEDRVYLCSPETAAASALTDVITDPRTLDMPYPQVKRPAKRITNREMLLPPLPIAEARNIELVKGPNIASLPELDPFPDDLELPILLKVGDDMSTDEIMPAGARVLPYRSNIPRISEFVYDIVDPEYAEKALALKPQGGHAIIGGENYGQGSSREHAALAPRYLGLRVVLAKSFARIHRKNLVNYGTLPLDFDDDSAYDKLKKGDVITLSGLRQQLVENKGLEVKIQAEHLTIATSHNLSAQMVEVLLAGGLTNWVRGR